MSNQQDINAIRAQRLANTHDPLALMANTQTPFHPDQSLHITYRQHPQPNNNFVLQPSFNTNYMQQPMQNPEDISDPITALDMALELMSKAFQLNNTTTTNNNQISFIKTIATLRNLLIGVVPGIANQHGNGNVVASRDEGNSNEINGNQIRCYNCRGEGIQLNYEEFDFMAAAGAYDEIEKVTANCTLQIILQACIYIRIERLQARLGDQKGKSKDTPCISNTFDPLSQKLENENVELEFQVLNYAKENAHLKTTYKNLFDSISVTRTQTKTIIDSLQNKLHDTIYENAKLRAQLFDKVSEQKNTTHGTSTNTKFAK
ncbi:hypothetical protein Tco_0291567 [Tanacetum coccineum]